MIATPLSRRALNRATLARQLLLERATMSPVEAVARLFAMQAQLARPPFIGLWSRLEGFDREALHAALHRREIVRATGLRGTLHLTSAADYMAFRGAIQPVLDASLRSILKTRKATLPDPEALLALAEASFEASPQPFEALRDVLLARYPEADERAMGYAVRMGLPLVQVPTETEWGFPGTADFTTARAWLGAYPPAASDLPALVRRYLAGYGPASPKDMQIFTGLGCLKAVFEALRPSLVVLRDERGRELFDLAEAPRPPEETPAPVRFLPDFDHLVLGHDDRSRVIADADRPRIVNKGNLRVLPTFLVDGFVAGTWRLERKATASLSLTPFEPLAPEAREAIAEEGERLVRFAEPGAKAHALRFESP